MSFYNELKEGLIYLVDTSADIYKEQLKQGTEKDRIEATNKVTKQLADNSFMIGETTFSIKKTLLIFVGVLGTILILRSAK